jgi:hypothetical protein
MGIKFFKDSVLKVTHYSFLEANEIELVFLNEIFEK